MELVYRLTVNAQFNQYAQFNPNSIVLDTDGQNSDSLAKKSVYRKKDLKKEKNYFIQKKKYKYEKYF